MPLSFRKGLEKDLDITKLVAGEPAYCTDSKKILVGNGDGTATEMQSDLITGGWTLIPYTCAYLSATSFTVGKDLVTNGPLAVGDKLKIVQGTNTFKGYIISLSVSNGATTVTVTGGSDYSLSDAAISAAYFSKAENPAGFSNGGWFNWVPTVKGYVNMTVSNLNIQQAVFKISGHVMLVAVVIDCLFGGTLNEGAYISLPIRSKNQTTLTCSIDMATSTYVSRKVAWGYCGADDPYLHIKFYTENIGTLGSTLYSTGIVII